MWHKSDFRFFRGGEATIFCTEAYLKSFGSTRLILRTIDLCIFHNLFDCLTNVFHSLWSFHVRTDVLDLEMVLNHDIQLGNCILDWNMHG